MSAGSVSARPTRLALPAALLLAVALSACGGGPPPAPAPVTSSSSSGGSSSTLKITSIQPSTGPSSGGTLVTLTGTDFTSVTTVRIGLVKLAPLSLTDTTLQVVTPAHDPGTFDVWAIGSTAEFAIAFNAFTFEPPAGQPVLFTNVTNTAGISFVHREEPQDLQAGTGVAVADFDNDGWDDFYLTNSIGANALYLNQQDGTFTDKAPLAGVELGESHDNGACAADFDNDGDPDLYVTARNANHLFQNNGDATFTDITATAGVGNAERSMTCAWGDFDRDGWLDLYVANYVNETPLGRFPRPDALYRNRGDATFEDASAALPGTVGGNAAFVTAWTDYDNDGDLDNYVVSDFGATVQPNVLLRNDGASATLPWSFTDVSGSSGAGIAQFGMGLAVGDYNGDGWLDFYSTDLGRNELLRNNGNGTFTDATNSAGVGRGTISQTNQDNIGWGAFFFDFDNDGDADLYFVAGSLNEVEGSDQDIQPNALFQNNGDATFTDISSGSGANDPGRARGAAYLDFDNDGDLDILIANYNQAPVLLRNDQATGNAWLIIRLEGNTSNRDGIGARIRLTVGGVTQIREVRSGSSHCANNMLAVHFGLGANETVDQLEVRWPSGTVQTFFSVPARQYLTLVEP